MELPLPAMQLIYDRTMQHRLNRNSLTFKEVIMLIPAAGAAAGFSSALGNAAIGNALAEGLTALKLKTQAAQKGRQIAEAAI
ncbi:MAG TPA: hypothetical protein VEC35_14915 [Noviherbaspirillum sp.]|nr:hypothetical protein [Noviherbaspirillum sp.]